MWKQRPGFYNWGLAAVDGSLRSDSKRAQILADPRALALPGANLRVAYDDTRKRLLVTGSLSDRPEEPALFYAPRFTYKRPPRMELTAGSRRWGGRATVESVGCGRVQGWRLTLGLPRVPGPYQVVMAP
ncbi:MAG: hypothetical protein ACP5QO_00340 [Clostridia bacterium]